VNILVTAGNTQTPIDRVRCLTNIFSGRTGANIAVRAAERGHTVTLLTSHPEVLLPDSPNHPPEPSVPATSPTGGEAGSIEKQEISNTGHTLHLPPRGGGRRSSEARTAGGGELIRIEKYQTFEDLDSAMEREISTGGFDAVIHAAAVNDYLLAGTFAKVNGELADVSAGKVKGNHEELWLKFRPAPKLVDKIRSDWHFTGTLVKFKLEVGVGDAELLEIAERSRVHSHADWMVANTLEGMHEWAFAGAEPHGYRRVTRADLADAVLALIEGES